MATGKAGSGSPNWVLIGIGALALLTVYVGFIFWPVERGGPGPLGSGPVACTMEAKLCPDGSAVGRTGPNCEFAACPGAQAPSGWKVFLDDSRGISFQYPGQLGSTYTSPVDWPPQILLKEGPFSCVERGSGNTGRTERLFVGTHEYCVTRSTEGAAGSIYTEYTYAFPRGERVAVLTFTIRTPQCVNYEQPQRSACEAERASFSIDALADRMAQSLRLE